MSLSLAGGLTEAHIQKLEKQANITIATKNRNAGPVDWVVGVMGDAAPPASEAGSTVHYLIADGCVHVHGASVNTNAIVRKEAVPLGPDGVHCFPQWL